MALDFDVNEVRKHKFELLDCQVELVLRSLEFYAYSYRFVFPRFGGSVSKDENLRISLVCDTYEQILSEFGDSYSGSSLGCKAFGDLDDFLKKVS